MFVGENVSDEAFDSRDQPLKRLKGSVSDYRQTFEPVGINDRESAFFKGLTPDTAHADELANPTMDELGKSTSDECRLKRVAVCSRMRRISVQHCNNMKVSPAAPKNMLQTN